jgi:hypothetical protein
MSTLLTIWSTGNRAWKGLVMPVVVIGSLAAGRLYGLAWGWKGLVMTIAIALAYSAAAIIGAVFWLQS